MHNKAAKHVSLVFWIRLLPYNIKSPTALQYLNTCPVLLITMFAVLQQAVALPQKYLELVLGITFRVLPKFSIRNLPPKQVENIGNNQSSITYF